jgi:hypothetical protein
MERKLDVGETFSEVFDIYRDQAGVLLPVAFWLFLLVAVVNVLIGNDLALLPLAFLVGTIAGTLYQGMVVNLVRDVQDGRRDSSVGELIRSGLPVLLPLIGAGILAAIGIGLGLLLLVVPGLFLATIWAVIAPAIVVERRGVFEAFGRSRELVRGNGWPVFGVTVVAILITIVATIVFTSIADAVADGPIVEVVFGALASTLTAPIAALVAGVLYFRLLAIKGEQPSAEGLMAPDPTAPPSYDPPPPPTPGT